MYKYTLTCGERKSLADRHADKETYSCSTHVATSQPLLLSLPRCILQPSLPQPEQKTLLPAMHGKSAVTTYSKSFDFEEFSITAGCTFAKKNSSDLQRPRHTLPKPRSPDRHEVLTAGLQLAGIKSPIPIVSIVAPFLGLTTSTFRILYGNWRL